MRGTAPTNRSSFTTRTRTNPKFSYDPTGVAVTGRYVVRFNTDWSQSVTPGRSDVQIELIELA